METFSLIMFLDVVSTSFDMWFLTCFGLAGTRISIYLQPLIHGHGFVKTILEKVHCISLLPEKLWSDGGRCQLTLPAMLHLQSNSGSSKFWQWQLYVRRGDDGGEGIEYDRDEGGIKCDLKTSNGFWESGRYHEGVEKLKRAQKREHFWANH